MSTWFFATRSGLTFTPVGEVDATKARGVKEGEICKITVSQPRNLARHRHFFAMMQEVLDQWPEDRTFHFATTDLLLDALKEAIGWYEPFFTLKGEKKLKLKSISFTECDQPEFMERVWHPCVALMAQMIHVTEEELITNTRLK